MDMIPKLVHQIFYDFGAGKTLEDYPRFVECLSENRRFCEETGYIHTLWENEEIDELIATEFPGYLKLWEDFTQPIQRVDFARYCILHRYGGIYIDLDIKIIQDPGHLLDQSSFFTTWNDDKRKLPYNAVMGAEAGLPLYQDILRHCQESFYEKQAMGIYEKWTGRFVFQTTGHFMLNRVLKKHKIKPMDLLKVNTKKGGVVSSENPYFEDWNISSWYS
tara:strand:+ start:77 stop:733 length:657 start_codon:yes stop_codon:yes gene_type:complete